MPKKDIHRLLSRQISFHLKDDKLLNDPKFEAFFDAINQAYYEYDDDKKLLENIITENQEELLKVNEELAGLNTNLENLISSKTRILQEAFQVMMEKEFRLRSILDNIAELILILDDQFVIQFASENFYRLIDFNHEQLIGSNINLFLNKKQMHEFDKLIASTNSKPAYFQIELPTQIGTISTFEANVSIHDLETKHEFVLTLRDVTEVQKIQNQIKNQKEFYENILENIPADIAIFDKDHRYLYLNPRAIKDPELRAFIIGKTDFEYAKFRGRSTKYPAERHALFLDAVAKKSTITMEEKVVNKEGKVTHLLRHFTPIFNSEGLFEIMIGLGIEITDRKLAEEKVDELNQNLEEKVLQRTAQLELAIKELDAFSYSVSHDLRSPLRAVDGWSLALLEDFGEALEPQAKEYIQRVRLESQRMATLIDDLLNLSKIGKTKLNVQKIDFTSFCKQISSRLIDQHGRKDVVIEIADNLFLNADKNLLDIMMTNLISNALKFSGKVEKPKISIGKITENHTEYLFIKDNGAGFNSQITSKLFGAFQRMHKQSEFPGTGIGLATVKRIVELHSGQIWAESQINEGATFKFNM